MILDKLGIYGIDPADEKSILAGMLLGSPILLIGEHGSAKTEIARLLAVALLEHSKTKYEPTNIEINDYNEFGILPKKWTQHAIYDCSKVQFEELIGFPNPTTFSSGYVNFVRSPITIWDKKIVVLDEFNRQTRRQQNSLFELIRSRTIYGRPTGAKIVFACMNPYGMEGTEILDEALVDRMGCFIYTKGFDQLDDIVRDSIIQREGPSDSPGLVEWTNYKTEFDSNGLETNTKLAEIGKDLTEIFTNAARILEKIKTESGESYSLFVNRFLTYFIDKSSQLVINQQRLIISSRRASMMYRMLMAYRAVEVALSEVYNEEVSCQRKAFANVLCRTLPIGIAESTGNISGNIIGIINNIIEMMDSYFVPSSYASVRSSLDTLHEILTTTDIVRKTALIVDYMTENSELENQIWNEITNSSSPLDTTKGVQTAVLSLTIANLIAYNANILPQSIVGKILSNYSSISNNIKIAMGKFSISGENITFKHKILADIATFNDKPFKKLYASLLWKNFVEGKQKNHVTIDENDFVAQSTKISTEVSRLGDLLEKIVKRNNITAKPIQNVGAFKQLSEDIQCEETTEFL